MRKLITCTYSVLLALALALSLSGCGALSAVSASSSAGAASSPVASLSSSAASASSSTASAPSSDSVVEGGEYGDKDSVALYVHEFGHLPSNYISKTKARAAGWVSTEGNLWEVLPGKSIGGSEYYNDDGQLPDAPGRRWTECDIGYAGGYRNAERLVFSNDGLIFYTGDHYETFEQLY